MSNVVLRKARRPLVALAAVTALFMAVGVAQAAAAISTDKAEVSLEEMVSPYPAVHVTGSGFTAYEGEKAKDLYAGICTVRTIEGAPDCGNYVPVSVASGGALSATVTLTAEAEETAVFANAHSVIKGHPPNFDCFALQAGEGGCVITVVNHTTFEFLGSQPITFTE